MNDCYVPRVPFDGYKWYFATKAPTESLGDPAVLLGLINRIAPLENGIIRYSSIEFTTALMGLDRDIETTVDLSSRVGERNLMRNSSQYWKLFGLIPLDSHGIIQLTPLAREIAAGKINQVDFAASMIVTFKLPNAVSYSEKERWQWEQNDLVIHPFKLILSVMRELNRHNAEDGWLTNQELYKVIVPMAGDKKTASTIAEHILAYRKNPSMTDHWHDCVPRSNDKRFCGEYLRFLHNFGYVAKKDAAHANRDTAKYFYINELDCQIAELIEGRWAENSGDLIKMIQSSDIAGAVAMSSVSRANSRPGQQRFRHDLLSSIKRCPITGVDLPTVLQAAHIKPHAFGGPENVDNGLILRADIHCLFDAGLLSIKPMNYGRICKIELSDPRVVANYREYNDKFFELPEITNMEYVEWRYDNRLLGIVD